jgi:hypothetical protein
MPQIALQSGLLVGGNVQPSLPDIEEHEITPCLIVDYDYHVRSYCMGLHKPPKDEKAMLAHILYTTCSCPVVYNWVRALGHRLDGKTFTEFVELLKARFLDTGWEDALVEEIKKIRMRSSERFSSHYQRIIVLNNCLQGTAQYLDDKKLISIVFKSLCPELKRKVEKKSSTRRTSPPKCFAGMSTNLTIGVMRSTTNERKGNVGNLSGARAQFPLVPEILYMSSDTVYSHISIIYIEAPVFGSPVLGPSHGHLVEFKAQVSKARYNH